MRLKFKHQKFQADAARAVCDLFEGQPRMDMARYLIDKGNQRGEMELHDFTGFRNHPIVPELTDKELLKKLQQIQRGNLIAPSQKLEGRFNLTIEMETGTGKTYTYIKTMLELNKRYGWSKFIIVVPSIAIREGVYKTFQITQEHFAEEYGQKIHFFVYDSSRLVDIDRFASDSAINVMIINSQAFNARGAEARRIYMKLDSFRSRRPIDVIAKSNPIVIIDEPQKVEGKTTKEKLKEFNPLLTLRYSATHKRDSLYNMVYRLDALEAYNKRLVKKIAVKGITTTGSSGSNGYLYMEKVNLYTDKSPTANVGFEIKQQSGLKTIVRQLSEGSNLYDYSNGLEEYREGYIITQIDGRDDSVSFQNGLKIYAGDVVGAVNETQLRRIQIRETILSHIERERKLFQRGIKVLSLFFIDEVAKYKQYDAAGVALNGLYGELFEEEYSGVLSTLQMEFGEEHYFDYLKGISAAGTHVGYFSVDKKKQITEKKSDRGAGESADTEAFDLIMRNKEQLLSFKEPARFIFSHSALREGWDNPNVFQICTLKQSATEIGKRQEVGRGMRLSVNQQGDRMDAGAIGEEVHEVNVLTVIANESYDSFARAIQTEMAEVIADRPQKVSAALFENKVVKGYDEEELTLDSARAELVYEGLIAQGYVKAGALTEKFYEEKRNGAFQVAEEVAEYRDSILTILDTIYHPKAIEPENARSNNVELRLDRQKFERKEFQELWKRINTKTAYVVDFETEELVQRAITKLNAHLHVAQIYYKVQQGEMTQIKSKEALTKGESFKKKESWMVAVDSSTHNAVRYDLVGKVVEETGLTRNCVVQILSGITPNCFEQFKQNPEEFILKASKLINEEKATAIVQHISYNRLSECFGTEIFTEPTLKGKLGVNAVAAKKHLYDYVIFDSIHTERPFAEQLEVSIEVALYVKLPKGFYINTPVGKYNPDWAIAFEQGVEKHVYFVAETKGSMSSMDLRLIESAKIHCAREHFRALSGEGVRYDVVNSYDDLMKLVK